MNKCDGDGAARARTALADLKAALRYLRTRSLTPFGVYCVVAGVACLVYLGLVK